MANQLAVVEREALQCAQRMCGTGDVLCVCEHMQAVHATATYAEHNKGLAVHLGRLHGNNVEHGAEL